MGSTPANIKALSFPQGGIHPPDSKLSSERAVRPVTLPSCIVLPLGQHIGAPSKPLVKPGDKVKTGQLLAEASGFVSANLHSSVSGTVSKIDGVIDVSGYKKPAIFIDVQGDDWVDSIDRTPGILADISLSSKDILQRITDAGLVGLGGATFPTHVKLAVPPGKKPPQVLLINGVECEPYLTSDHRLMLEHPQEIMIGIRLLMKATGVTRAILGIETNKMDAITLLTRYSDPKEGIQVQALKMQYPQGGERQLVKALIGKEIPPPPRGLPIDVGAVVINVATVFAVYEAVQKRKPLIERIVTVTGKSVKDPGNFRTRFGVSFDHLVSLAGGIPDDTGKVTAGGPMMGRAFADLSAPVTKGTSGIVFYPRNESLRETLTNCIRCGKCVEVCPLGLEPYLVAALAEQGNWTRAEQEKLTNCCECSCCAYICPANRPLVDFIKLGKSRILDIMKKRQKV